MLEGQHFLLLKKSDLIIFSNLFKNIFYKTNVLFQQQT